MYRRITHFGLKSCGRCTHTFAPPSSLTTSQRPSYPIIEISTNAPNNGVELTGADVSVFGWSGFMLFLSLLSAPAAHPERWVEDDPYGTR
jgi:hypothetical protein